MPNDITSTNHGLTVLTNADSDPNADATDNQRLRRPVAEDITNRFNDATSGGDTPAFSSGHEGLDFACNTPTEVKAMYGGEVCDVKDSWVPTDGKGYGIHIEIRSSIDRTTGTGFEHLYGHLSRADVNKGDSVSKGDVIGLSGDTGTYDDHDSTREAHLHVHVKPFDESGAPDDEFAPDNDQFNLTQSYPPLATRIHGCMNFACFLPADGNLPAITAAGPLLSARDAYAYAIPVYTTEPEFIQRGTINGAKLGCYAVTGQYPEQGTPTRYQIQFADPGPDPVENTGLGWVSRLGTVGTHSNVQWVHVQDNTISLLIIPPEPVEIGAPQHLQFTLSGVTGTRITLSWTAPELAAGTAITGYRIERYLQDGDEEVIDVLGSGTRWTDPTEFPAGTYLLYRVAALVGTDVGTRSVTHDVVSGDQALIMRQWGNVEVPALDRPAAPQAVTGNLEANLWHRVTGWLGDRWEDLDVWVRILLEGESDSAPSRDTRGAAARSNQTEGWVRRSQVQLTGSLAGLPRPPFVRVTAPGLVPVRPGPSLGYTTYVAQIERAGGWYEIMGENQGWWQVRVDAATVGWLQGSQVETTGAVSEVSFVDESPAPEPAGPGGTLPSGNAITRAAGHYLNLANSWGGAWAVSKAGREVTAAFQSTRSPVQWYARTNVRDLAVLPVGFRPRVTQDVRVTGVHVTETGVDYAQAPQATFTLRVYTTGQVRYVDGSELDHVGFLRYEVGTPGSGVSFTWRTQEALVTPVVPETGETTASGFYLNQQENAGSNWTLSRLGTRVWGSFSCTSSPVDYYANGADREAQLLLPEAYRPTEDEPFQVMGAVRVEKGGGATSDLRRVNFWLTVQPNGEMWYDEDSSLQTQGVGHLSYAVAVQWHARVRPPSAPQGLTAADVEAEEVELAWDAGEATVDKYRVEIYRRGSWIELDDDISRTRYTVEDLDPYTTYTFRVAAHNEGGWGLPSTGVTVSTLREAPGQPRSLTATATHDRVTLTWQAPPAGGQVTGYRVERSAAGGGSPWRVVAADTGSAVTYWVDRAVTPATTYEYDVQALNHGEPGRWSSEETVTTLAAPTIPGSPTGLGVAPSAQSQLQLTWLAPAALGGGVTGYRIERSPDVNPRTWTEVVADTRRTTLIWDEQELAADTIYHYQVSARNSAGVGGPSGAAQGQTRPQLRLDLPVVYPLTAQAAPRADAAVTATFGFFLPERTYDLVGQVPGADGWWQVLLFGQSAPGPFWLPARAGTALGATAALPQLPAAPGSFTATLAAGQVSLSWSAPARGGALSGYRLWRQQDTAAFAQLGADLAAAALTHTDSTVQNGHVYRYWLQALADPGPGLPSPTVALAVMATPAAPAAVPMVNVAATSRTLQLDWTRAATGGLPSGYRLQWRRGGTTDSFQEGEVIGTTHTLVDLIPDTPYEFQVTAFNQEGDAAPTMGTGTTLQEAPGVPGALTVTTQGPDAVVSWQAPLTGGRADSYALQYHLTADAWPATETAVAGLSHTLTGLSYAQAAQVRVRAGNTAGMSAWVTVSMPALPGVPTGLTAHPGADSQMQLAWQAAPTGGAATGYRIERAADVLPRVWTEVVADSGSPALSWDDSGLDASTVYHYQVSGRNRVDVSAASGEAMGTTRPQLTLKASASYPLTAQAWPEASAPTTHTWPAHDATVVLDLVAQGAGSGWYRALRFGESAGGPYWLPESAVTVRGTTTALPQVAGVPGDLEAMPTPGTVTLTWSAPSTGGTVTGYRLWRQTGTGTFAVLGPDLADSDLTYLDTTGAPSTAYAYRVQALSAAGAGLRTGAVGVTTAGLQPVVQDYGPGTHTLTIPDGYRTLYVQLCGGAGGGGGAHLADMYAGETGGAGGCTFASFPLQPGDTWTLTMGRGGAGGATDENDPDDGRAGTASFLHRNGSLVATGAYGQGGEAGVGWAQSAAAGATTGNSYQFPRSWTADAPAPAGGRRGSWQVLWDGAAGAAGKARVLLTPSLAPPPLPPALVQNYGLGTHTMTIPTGYNTLYVMLCGGGGGGAGGSTDYVNGGRGGNGGCTFYTAPLGSHTWSLVLGDGGDGGDYKEYGGLAGYRGRSSRLEQDGISVATAPGGEGGFPHNDIGFNGAVTGSSQGWHRAWPGGETPPLGGWGGVSHREEDGRDGAAGRAQVLLIAAPTAPDAPTMVQAQPTADSQMELRWEAAATGAAATGYRIERSADALPRVWTEVLADSGSPDTIWADSDLDASTVYHYQVTGRNAEGLGTPAVAATGTTRPQLTLKTNAPYPLAAQAWPTPEAPVTHTWPAHDAMVQLDVVGKVRGTDGWYRGLRFGQAATGPYWLPARAVTLAGSATGVLEAPGVPGGHTPPVATHDSVTLSWSVPPTGGPVTGYRLWRQTGAAAFMVLGADLAAAVLTYTDTGLDPETAYQYRVQAVSAAGYGPRTPAVSVTTAETPRVPGVPPVLAAQPAADSQMQLVWTAPGDPGTQPLSGYRIERAVDAMPLVWMEVVADTGTLDRIWDDTALAASTVYHYRVSAHNAVGVGNASPEATGTARPQLALSASAAYPLTAHAWPAAAAPVTQTWLAYDAAVHLDLVAQDASGSWYRALRFGQGATGPYWLPASAVIVSGPTAALPQTPGLPGDLASPAATYDSFSLSWSAPTTGGPVTGYRLWRQSSGTDFTVLGSDLGATRLTYADTAVNADTLYQYRVQALAAVGAGIRTPALSVRTLAAPRLPDAPTMVQAQPTADSQMELRWEAAATGGPVTGYRIERSADVLPRVWTEVLADSGSPDTIWADSDLAASTVHHYRVTGRNAEGLGTPSGEATGTTRPQLALLATASYPLTAHAWPAAPAPVTQTWLAHDARVQLDLVGQGAGGGGWYRALRFGQGASGPYWLPASAVTVTGSTTDLAQAPGVPGELAPPVATHDSVTLSWSAPTTGGTVTGYRLWRQTGEADFTVLGADLAADVLTYTDTTAAASTAYQYRLQALSAVGAGVRTPAVSVTTAATPRVPGIPPALTAQPTADSHMQLSWAAPVDAGTQPLTGYRIERAVAATPLVWIEVLAATGTLDRIWDDTALAASTVYHYRVSARNAVGLSDPAAAQGTTRPQLTLLATAPYPLTAHQWPAAAAPVTHTWNAHDAQVVLDLTAQGAGGGGWYRALRFGQGASGPYWLPARAVAVSGTTSALPQTPGSPGDLQTTDTQGQVTLTWTAPPTGGPVTGYRLWRQSGEADFAVLGSELSAAARTHTDTPVTAGSSYQYRLQARSAAGYGMRTAAVTAAVTAPPVAPAPPAYVAVAQVGATTAQLAWDPVAGATDYEVELRQAWYATDHLEARVRLPLVGTVTLRTGADSTVEVTVLRTGTLVELTGLPASYTYWDLYVRATNVGGPSAWVETYVSNDAADLALRQPAGLRGQRSAAGTAALHWDAVAGATAYRVYFDFPDDDQGAAGWDWLPYRGVELTLTAATATVSGLPTTPATWGLRVSARNAAGAESVRSAALAVSTAEAPRVPGRPTALTVAPGADSQLQLSWSAPADAGTQPLSGYRMARAADVLPRVWTEVLADSGHLDLTWSDRGLAAATTYHYQVSARNAVGVGQPAAPTSGQTRPQVTLVATAPYPVMAHQGPAASAPATHTWLAHDAAVRLDLVAQAAGGSWWRVLRFGHSASGPYWLPAAAVTVTGSTTAVPAVPDAPTMVQAQPTADSQMELRWVAAATGGPVTGYRIERSADVLPRVWTEVLADSGSPAVTWSDSGLAAATTYHYQVTGRNDVGLGLPSGAATGTTRPQLALLATAPYPLTAHQWPAAPAPVTHTWLAHDARVQLDLVGQGAGGGGWYRALRFGQGATGPYWLPASAVTPTGSATGLAQAPGVPGDLAPPTATHDTVTLSWSAPTTGGPVTGYRLWRQPAEGAFVVLGIDLAADVLTHMDLDVTASTAYQYRLQAVSAAGAGPRGVAVAVTTAETPRVPGLPPALAAQPTADSQMTLSWTAPPDTGTQPLSGYRIERSADVLPRVWMEVVADTGTTDVSWSDRGLAAATTYHYQVRARNAVGGGDPATAQGTTRPQLTLLATAPYPLTAHQWPAAPAPVTQTWPAYDAMVHLDLVAQGPGGGGWYRALRFGQAATGPYWLPASAVTTTGSTSGLPQAPGIPGDLQTTDTLGQVTLIWNAPPSGGTVTGYRLWRQSGEAPWAALDVVLAAHTLSHTDTTVTIDSTYQYRLQAQAAAGYGPRSAPLTAAVTPPPPADLTYVAAAQVGATTVQLAWDPVPGATHYDVELRQSWYAADHVEARVRLPLAGTVTLRTGPETTDTVPVTVLRTGTLVELTGLPASYIYWDLYVRATNAGGPSAWVETFVYNDPADPAALLPRQPTGLRGQRSATGTAALHWDAVAGAADYRVYFDFPNDDQGAAGWDWLPYRGVELTLAAATATVSGLPTTPATWGLRVSARNAAGAESVRAAALTVANPPA